MGMQDISFPRYVYQQDTQPTDAGNGAIWVDTNASPIETFVYNGSSWVSLSTDVGWVASALAQSDINILINSVGASTTLNDYDTIFVDNFTDTNGTSNTIDTGNTTALYDSTNKYYINGIGDGDEAHADPPNEGQNVQTAKSGMKITLQEDATIVSITKDNLDTSTTCYIQSAYGSGVLATQSFSGNVATFNYAATKATNYFILTDSGGASYNRSYDVTSVTLPQDTGEVNWVSCYDVTGAEQTNRTESIVSIQYSGVAVPSDKIVQSNSITIPSGITHHQIYCKNTLVGTGAITYDFSADGGSTWDTAQALGSKNTFAATTGTSCIIKINLDGTGGGNTSQASDYGIIVWT